MMEKEINESTNLQSKKNRTEQETIVWLQELSRKSKERLSCFKEFNTILDSKYSEYLK